MMAKERDSSMMSMSTKFSEGGNSNHLASK